MATDIKLDHGSDSAWIAIEAAAVKVTASDLMVDAPERRSAGGGPYRRALVHGEDDSLVVNFGGDYPGGTQINDAFINLRLEQASGADPELPKIARAGALRAVQTTLINPVPGSPFTDTQPGPVRLYLCTSSSELTKEASWSEVHLGEAIAGKR